MPLTWYNTPDRIASLDTAAQSWHGTPWRLNSAFPGPGGGVSCSRLASSLYVATGFLAPFTPPRDNLRALVLGLSKNLRDFFPPEVAARFSPVEFPTSASLLPGDLILMREKKSILHLGVMLSDLRFVHVLRATGVCVSSLRDSTYADALAEALRPTELPPLVT